MSDYKLISPLLDGFVMGDPINSHSGVACCPAMRENTDEKYIVKVVSVPASQTELDALLLTGAYPDAASANVYFKEQAEAIAKEAELLQQLSRLEGFLPYSGRQIVPMENNELGYQVYLIGSYKRTLEKHLRRNTMTHLAAVNLGLDLCAAMSICRRAGYIYVAGKPANVFIVNDREFRLGDLGFVALNSLKYSSLPARYRSCYTPPELHDALATLNPTVDTYAVGMMLYRIYNNGTLPFSEKAPLRTLPAPENADYEMAEIILKAISPNPRNRYQTPIEMGKALVSYMQRNIVNDVPIVPPTVEPPVTDISEEPMGDDLLADLPVRTAAPEPKVSEETAPIPAEPAEPEVPTEEDTSGAVPEEPEEMDEIGSLLTEANSLLQSDDYGDDEDEDEDDEPIEEVPAPAAPAVSDDDEDEDEDDEDEEDDAPAPAMPQKQVDKPKKKHPFAGIFVVLLIAALLFGGYYYYKNYYLMPIDSMDISSFEDTLTVAVHSQVDESMLTVVCTDTYGNTFSQPLSGGTAVFSKLNPDTLYKVNVEVEGFHKLTGAYFGSCTTAAQTKILNFEAKTGAEDGSAILSFTVEGAKGQDWIIEYQTEGEEARSVSLNGHMINVNDLTIGSVYTFTLLPAPGTEQYIVGENVLQFTARKNVIANNLTIVSCTDGVLTAKWDCEDDEAVESWTVRCYSEGGFDETAVVSEKTAQFSGITTDTAYTVEVTAAGMSQSARAYISANPTTITDVTVTDSAAEGLNVSWSYEGTTPEGGWLLIYSVDGSDYADVVKCASGSGNINMWIPGATYSLSIQAADGSTVFGGTAQYSVPAAEAFNSYALHSGKIQASLCKTPEVANWTYKDVAAADYVTTYSSGASVSIVLYSEVSFYLPSDQTQILYVIRNAEGQAITSLARTETRAWNTLWSGRHCGLTIPAMPTEAGNYTVSVYFNGGSVLTKSFTINA